MPTYNIAGIDGNTTKPRRMTVRAGSPEEANRAALRANLYVTTCDVAAAVDGNATAKRNSQIKLPFGAVRSLHIAISVQLAAGSTSLDAINALLRTTTDKRVRRVLTGLRDKIMDGGMLSSAFAQFPRIWKEDICSMVRAAEERDPSSLWSQIDGIVRINDENETLRKLIIRVVRQPIASLIVAAIAFIVILTFTLPRIGAFFKHMGLKKIPLVTQWLIALGNVIKENYGLIAISFLGVVLVLVALGLTGRLRPVIWWTARKTPILNQILANQAYARFVGVFGNMYASTSNVLESLGYAAAAMPDPERRIRVQLAVENVKNMGHDPVAALRRCGAIDDTYLNCIAPEGARPSITKISLRFRDRYVDEVAYLGDRFGAFLQAIAMAALVGCVGILVYSFIYPMLIMFRELADKM